MQVEFLGIPRERAGLSAVEIEAETLGELLQALAMRFPALNGLIAEGTLHRSVAANLNGDVFVRDPAIQLMPSDRVLILSADVGG